ncbi:TPA: hypothetical protein ACSTJ2_000200 [Serratia fonticola]
MEIESKKQAYILVKNALPIACQKINIFCERVLRTRGAKIGSGMGALLEALWGYEINNTLRETGHSFFEMAWFPSHQYHDFACVGSSTLWDSTNKTGEYFRVEAKSMNAGADESKAHFDVLNSELEDFDALLVLVWNWQNIDEFHYCPKIVDVFFGEAKPLTLLRDRLHIARGGSFVDPNNCPDGCNPIVCQHAGEPLNEQGKRERISGPITTRPSDKVSYAANFGGLVRMLKTRGPDAKIIFRRLRVQNSIINDYISFIHRNFRSEEFNHFSITELREASIKLGIDPYGISKVSLYEKIMQHQDYQDVLRNIWVMQDD